MKGYNAAMKPLKQTTREDYARRMMTVLNYIEAHLDEEISLEELAGVACFSSYHFHRIFHGMIGEPLKKYIRRLRLERAASRLKSSAFSVTQIALEAGYDTHEAFTRAFNGMFGMAPRDYRENYSLLDANNHKTIHFTIEAGTMKVDIIEMEPMQLACVRHVGPYHECGKAWEKLCLWAGPKGLLRPGIQFLGLCFDDPEITPPEKIRYDACITVDPDCPVDGEVYLQQTEGGSYARVTHFGPYEKLSQTYNQLCGQWVPAKGYVIASRPSIEMYMNSPEDTEPEDLITDIFIPLE